MAYVKPIQINPDAETRKQIEEMAEREHRKIGPMTLEIVLRFFAQRIPKRRKK